MKKRRYIAPFIFSLLLFMLQQSPAKADGIKNEGFILNKGQWPDSILSRATFSFGDIIIQKDGIVFFLRDANSFHVHHPDHVHAIDTSAVIHAHVYKMKFIGGHITYPKGDQSSSFKVNFIKGDDPSKWANDLSCYKKLVVHNLYPNIDLILFVTNTGIKYDLILRENANPDVIAIQYEGLDNIDLDKDGNLQLKTSLGNVTEKMPVAFIEKKEGSTAPVLCQYMLKNNIVHFKTAKISKSKRENLVIDPELIFATYSGSSGNADNWGNTATYDSLGSLYAAGIAFWSGFPVTFGAYDITFNGLFYGDPDVAVMKFSPTGTLVYATYLGGGRTEVPTSIIVNKENELYILGTTSSNGGSGAAFPTTAGAYDQTFNGGSNIYPLGQYQGIQYSVGSDLFVSKLNANGTSLLSSTFIGGSGNDGLLTHDELLSRNYGDVFRSEILLDSLGFVYIASHTQSSNILNAARPGYDLTYNGGTRDGIVIKMTPDLDDIVWNTYWGGSGLDACYSLQFGENNDLYIVGGTTSPDLPTGGLGLNPNFIGNVDGYIFKLSNDGTTLMASTYIGTSSVDQCYLVQTDQDGFVYVLGQSQGSYPIVNAPYSNPGSRQFIHKLNPALDQTIFSTQIGSGQNKTDLVPTAFLVNDCENIFISGWGGIVNTPYNPGGGEPINGPLYQGGNTNSLPITANAFQPNTDGRDFYLMVLKKNLEKLLYATYFGGSGEREHVDGGTSRFDKRGIVYQSVCAGCGGTSLFPVTPGAHSSTNNSFNCNNAVFKFDLSSLRADFEVDTTKLCGSGPVTFTNTSLGGASFLWDLGDGNVSNSSTTFIHTYQQPGTYTVQLIATDEATCTGRDTAEKIIEVISLPDIGFSVNNVRICKGDTVQLNAPFDPNYTYLWSPNLFLSDPSIHNPDAFPPSTRTYTLLIKDLITECENTDTLQVRVLEAKSNTSYENITGCQGLPKVAFKNSSTPGFQYVWNFGDGNVTFGEKELVYTYQSFGSYTVSVRVFNDLCELNDTLTIHLPEVKIPNLITPNDDQLNDTYVIAGMNNNWKLDIYNRWGNLVYTREPYDQSWGGEGLSGGVYYYLISDPQGNKCKGWVHVLK